MNDIGTQQINSCVNKLARQFPDNVSAAHVMAQLGNQQYEDVTATQQPDPIALQSLENLLQLEAMMNFN